MSRFTLRALMFVSLAASVVGCDLTSKGGPSILVIGVEGLKADLLSCDSEFGGEPGASGLQAMCEESVRFSHAFAPSTMSQPNLASLLTGLYPIDHAVHDNGANFLSARHRTVAEVALGKRYRTLFVSGGPPIWRKSGLAQGFETFDDVFDISPGVYYRGAGEVFGEVTRWLKNEVGAAPFLSVLHLADLQFPHVATKTNEGVVREKSAAGQLEEITESLDELVRTLKSRRRWNNTHVILVGVSGDLGVIEPEREPAVASLRAGSVQVTLLVKPAQKERDHVISWSVDRNVSLTDVGRTMLEWLNEPPPHSSLAAAAPESLAPALLSAEPNMNEDRLILTETGWPEWRDQAGLRFAVRQNQFLFVHDKRPLIFNTLTDRMESLSLRPTDPLWTSLNEDVVEILSDPRTAPFAGLPRATTDQLEVARELWRDHESPRRVRREDPWARWYLRQALAARDWREVKRLATEVGDTVGMFVAGRQLGEPTHTPRVACLRLVLPPRHDKRNYRPECEDERTLALSAWLTAKTDEEKQYAQDRSTRLFATAWIDQDVGRLNFLSGLRWDVDRRFPEKPAPIEYLLTLKEFEPFARKALGFLNAKALQF